MAESIPLFVTLFAMLVLTFSPSSDAAITCSDVVKNLRPCVSYLQTGSGMPPASCCAGARALASSVTSTADKQTACNCIKNAAQNINLKPELAKALPGNCGISLGFTVSPSTDCSKIS